MKKICHVFWIAAVVAVLSCGVPSALADATTTARVTGDPVNLRARPELISETVGQVRAGDVLTVISAQEEWVEVVPPEAVDVWVHSEFIVNDVVVVNKLNARSGPGINYNIIGSMARGEAVVRRGSFGDWVKIAPMADARLWISRDFVEIIAPPVAEAVAEDPSPMEQVEGPPMEESAADVAGEAPPPPEAYLLTDAPPPVHDASAAEATPWRTVTPPPTDLRLIPLDGQGRVVRREGLLKRSPGIFSRPPGAHRLVKREGNRLITLAYVRGDTARLNALLDRHLIIEGREYWVEQVKVPVVVVDAIEQRVFH